MGWAPHQCWTLQHVGRCEPTSPLFALTRQQVMLLETDTEIVCPPCC